MGGDGSGLTTPVATQANPKSVKSSKVPPELRALLRQAMRDGSDWHPQLHETVAQITGMKTSKCVRTRVYVTSASTMHSLLNVLAFGKEVSDEDVIDRSKFADVTDLHYLSHFVIRCFEEPSAPLSRSTSGNSRLIESQPANGLRYAVEVLFSPGVCVKDEVYEKGVVVLPDKLRESHLGVAPLQSICKHSECSLEDFDTFLTEILAEFGKLSQEPPGLDLGSPRVAM